MDNDGQVGPPTTLGTTSDVSANLTVQGGANLIWPASGSLGLLNLVVASNSSLYASNINSTVIISASTATIEAGARISADGGGYAPAGPGGGGGPGSGSPATGPGSGGGGGGYGGVGGSSPVTSAGGIAYDSFVPGPVDRGSPGGNAVPAAAGIVPGGRGGGAFRLNVIGRLQLEGQLSANGNAGGGTNAGGGSGGSIWISAGTLAGGGSISANGGAGGLPLGGGGGGGRIGIIYSYSNFYTGLITAFGGTGAGIGGAGTIYLAPIGTQNGGLIIADNGGKSGTNTTLGSIQSSGVSVTVRGGAVLSPFNLQTVVNLLVASNSFLLYTNTASQAILNVVSNVVVQTSGAIIADGGGNPSGKGLGAGVYGTGGGYGGFGGAGQVLVSGGATYGNTTEPMDLGSGGGFNGDIGMPAAGLFGGAGGGSLRLSVHGSLQVDGLISANGLPAIAPPAPSAAGGGSGGSLWVLVGKQFSGAGTISANGGAGSALGGGGGGGRIAITGLPTVSNSFSNSFTGTISAYGGGGSKIGGAGTVYYQLPGQGQGLVVVDNGGQFGTNTTLGTSPINGAGVTVTQGGALWGDNLPTLGALTVGSNGFVKYSASNGLPSQLFSLIVNSNLIVQAGGAILVDGLGSIAGAGTDPGQMSTSPTSGAGGGGYGGMGGVGNGGTGGASYGSFSSPTSLGSGGGLPYAGLGTNGGGNGGGSLRITVNKSLRVDGRISANGLPGIVANAGGGAGGSLWITASNGFTGVGIISANGAPGGSSSAGGGGGGRISITYNTSNTASTNTNFVGTLSAFGGSGYGRGGAGTIYLAGNPITQNPQLFVDNGGLAGARTGLGNDAPTGVNLQLSGAGVLVAPVSGSFWLYNLLIGPGSTLLFTNGGSLAVSRNVTIQPGGAISGSANASSVSKSTYGNGGPILLTPGFTSAGAGGGGYGGFGSAGIGARPTFIDGGAEPGYGGTSFGGAFDPGNEGGSGAPISPNPTVVPGGGVGGFPLNIGVYGMLTNNGRISSDGGDGIAADSGGGAGGAIHIDTRGLFGNGVISANGGAGNGLGGSGGGGRIYINNGSMVAPGSNSFTGTITAYGGGGTNYGGAGTVLLKGQQPYYELIVDNNGHLGTNTSIADEAENWDLQVQNGGALAPPNSTFSTFHDVLVSSNGWIVVSNQTFNINGEVDIQAGGGIIADGRGYPGGGGPGVGAADGNGSQGGGGGGFGGNGAPDLNGAAGGRAYGFITNAVQMGSGGGAVVAANAGAGGGVVDIEMSQAVPGTLTVDGVISANGTANINDMAGAGAGGSVVLNVNSLSGAGVISADGGSAFGTGGGGGGGRIFITTRTNQFTGATHAFGGLGATGAGGAGTLDIVSAVPAQSEVIVDNGGQTGATTPVTTNFPGLSGAFGVNVTVANGAVAYPSDPFLAVSNLTIGNGGLLIGSPQGTNLQVLVFSNLEVSVGGAIAVDAQGYPEANGPGAGTNVSGDGSGGGYGGMGGDSLSGGFGGGSYGSVTQPTDLGSGGGAGSGPTYNGGSEGGGALRMDVAGTINVDGGISANGNPGFQDNSGGGSGGSIWITANNVTGSGTISADGGEGELYGGAGGAGGRVAIYQPNHSYHTNTFLGVASAFGADGASFGDDGTVLFADVSAPQVVSRSPSGIVSNFVSAIDFQFSTAIDFSSLAPGSLTVTVPGGATLLVSTVSMLAPSIVRFTVPAQMANGIYSLNLAPQARNLYGQTMAHAYLGSFKVELPTISGRITDTNGHPVARAPVVPVPLLPVVRQGVTDANGFYTVTFVPGSTFTLEPYWPYGHLLFAPASRSYANFTASITNENYVAYTGIAPSVVSRMQDTNFMITWVGLQGVTYQVYCSTNLLDWVSYGAPIYGSNSVIQVPVPASNGPQQYFRVRANQ